MTDGEKFLDHIARFYLYTPVYPKNDVMDRVKDNDERLNRYLHAAAFVEMLLMLKDIKPLPFITIRALGADGMYEVSVNDRALSEAQDPYVKRDMSELEADLTNTILKIPGVREARAHNNAIHLVLNYTGLIEEVFPKIRDAIEKATKTKYNVRQINRYFGHADKVSTKPVYVNIGVNYIPVEK